MIFYKKINVDNFEEMRKELEIATLDRVNLNTRYWGEPYFWFKNHTPAFYNFIESRKKIPIRMFRFYLTPPYNELTPHADGVSNYRSPIGLNIPISGYENTTMDWYSCPANNFEDGNYGFEGISASRVIDRSMLKKIDSVVIDCPTFVRTDVVHGITNYKSTPRLVLSVRFPYTKQFGQNFEDVWKL
jgi:hypothetical protein